jgi:hypothetical protein
MPLANPGAISDVVAGGGVDPDWGNAIRDRVVNVFADATARDAAITVPKEGMACWLADVDQFQVYNGVAWRLPWSQPWGVMGTVTPSSATSNTTTVQDIAGGSITFTAVAHRRYKLHAECNISGTVTGDVASLIVNDGSGDLFTNRGQVLAGATAAMTVVCEAFSTPGAGAVTMKCRKANAAGAGTVTFSGIRFYVEDCGPNGTPA